MDSCRGDGWLISVPLELAQGFVRNIKNEVMPVTKHKWFRIALFIGYVLILIDFLAIKVN